MSGLFSSRLFRFLSGSAGCGCPQRKQGLQKRDFQLDLQKSIVSCRKKPQVTALPPIHREFDRKILEDHFLVFDENSLGGSSDLEPKLNQRKTRNTNGPRGRGGGEGGPKIPLVALIRALYLGVIWAPYPSPPSPPAPIILNKWVYWNQRKTTTTSDGC